VTQKLIVTTPANSGQGDSPKAAFDKCNDNFTDLYSTTGGTPGDPSTVSHTFSPAVGKGLTINSNASDFGLGVVGANIANSSFGIIVQAGTSSSDFSLRIQSEALADALVVFGDGGVTVGSPTGSDLGPGTINAQAAFVQGGQIFSGIPSSSNTTATLSDVGKCIQAIGSITIPNGVFSIGNAFNIYNNSASPLTIVAGIITMRLSGTNTTGSRTLAARGFATVWFENSTDCVVSGTGVT
jgi:hypothetical protein